MLRFMVDSKLREKTGPVILADCRVCKIELSHPHLSMRTVRVTDIQSALHVADNILEVTVRRLSKANLVSQLMGDDTRPNGLGDPLILSFGQKHFLMQDANLFFDSLSFADGSINTKASITLAAAFCLYEGVVQYPQFREGLDHLRNDVAYAVQAALRIYSDSVDVKDNDPLSPDDPFFFEHQVMFRNDEDIVADLIQKLREAQ